MRLLPYGDRALLAEFDDIDSVVAWSDAVRRLEPEGVADVVPAARTVLVVAETPGGLEAMRRSLAAIGDVDAGAAGAEGAGRNGPEVEIPVRYDGPDLFEVARLTGLDEAEVVRAHTARAWRVAFGGFAPGFAYLSGGDERLRVPRRDEARTQVPVGAVGLAGEFSGVYPRSSPGGWQLIGTTEEPMWDIERDRPALLSPGALVHFLDVGKAA